MTALGWSGPRLRAARESAGLSQRALADRVGIAQPHVSAMEADKMRPALDTLARMARALGVTTDHLLGL